MKSINKIIGAIMLCGTLVIAENTTELMIPKTNPILQQIREKSAAAAINIQQIPTVSAVDVRLLIDNSGNVLAMAMVDPVAVKEQVKAKTFRQKTTEHFQQHWSKWLIGTIAAAAVDRVAENNDWLWHNSSSSKPAPSNTTGNWNITTTGDNNTFNINNNQPNGGGVDSPTSSSGSPVDNSNNSVNGGF
jgi:hypothetical protein